MRSAWNGATYGIKTFEAMFGCQLASTILYISVPIKFSIFATYKAKYTILKLK